MAKVKIDEYGTKIYYNDLGEWHRPDGPAIIRIDGSCRWFIGNSQDNPYHPSDKDSDGSVWWAIRDYWHRDNGPTADYPNGMKRWMEEDEIIWPKL